jgi:peroxiredoxin Q/BCP
MPKPTCLTILAITVATLLLGGCDSTPMIQHTNAAANTQMAPDFTLQNHEAKMVQLSGLRGQWVLLYFYPLSDTPSCACQANEFTGLIRNIGQVNATPLAISVDMPDMVDVYRSKYQLPFTLLGDETAQVTKMYAAWKGNAFNGVTQRTAILIDPAGRIVYRMPVDHAEGTIAALQSVRNRFP